MADASMQTIKDTQGRVKGYKVRWRNKPGILPQQPSKTFDKGQKALAEAFLARVRFNSAAVQGGLPTQSKTTLEAFYVQHYLPTQKSTRATTKATADSLWNVWIKPFLGSQDIATITAVQVEGLLNQVKSAGHYATARKVRSMLRAILAMALRLALVAQNVVL
ncbi:MAG: phage integrase central domain-containing protein, partial [Actinomycetota bacterium]